MLTPESIIDAVPRSRSRMRRRRRGLLFSSRKELQRSRNRETKGSERCRISSLEGSAHTGVKDGEGRNLKLTIIQEEMQEHNSDIGASHSNLVSACTPSWSQHSYYKWFIVKL